MMFKRKKGKGFTFIEVLVVIGIISFALPALFAIIFGILKEETKIYALREIKRQGDITLNIMRTTIQNNGARVYSGIPAGQTNEQCASTSTFFPVGYPASGTVNTLYFQDATGAYFGYQLLGNSINLDNTSPGIQVNGNLTTDRVVVSNLSLRCDRTASFSPPVISVSFDIAFNTSSTRTEDIAKLTYQTKIKMKNF